MDPASSEKNLYYKPSGGNGNGKLFLVLVVAAVCLALAAFVIGIVSLAKQSNTTSSPSVINVNSPAAQSTQSDADDDDKVWLFHVGEWDSNLEYIDEESGEVRGFISDIVDAVCRIANKNCRRVFDIYTNCWKNVAGEQGRGGVGLMSGWYDACSGWRPMKERTRTFAFGDSFTRDSTSTFVTLPGNPDDFNWRDLTGKKIGFGDGYSTSEHCVASANEGDIVGKDLTPDQIFHYHDFDTMLVALKAKEIDALFLSYGQVDQSPDVEVVSGELDLCKRPGLSAMARFDSKLVEWWNPALAKLVASKEYGEICQDSKDEHGHWPGRDPRELCLPF